MTTSKKVLAITKRTADLCATQGLLYAAGFELITATNVVTARAMLRSLKISGVIICLHSWDEAERESIASEMLRLQIPTMNCPGCTGCDEALGKPGALNDTYPLTSLIMKFGTDRT